LIYRILIKYQTLKGENPKFEKKRLRSSYFTSIISISLVLFLIGLMGLLVLNAKVLSNYIKESLNLSIILKENVKEVEVRRLQKNLDAADYVKYTEFISKDQAAKELQDELGEDFIDFLGYNPLLASIDVYLHAPYANTDSIVMIEGKLMDYSPVKEVYYHESLIYLINKNIRKISFVILVFSGLLFLIALTLVNNTIRLSVYSKRFLIHTMQLVGATRAFIRRPFIKKSILHGILAAFIAIFLILGSLYLLQKDFPELIKIQDMQVLAMLFGGVILLGIFFNLISTFFAVNKYLRMEEGDLYY
jgi:cell division transport system permease protein